MNTRKYFKKVSKIVAVSMALIILSAVSANAATCSVSGSAPVIDNLDIANYAASTGTDKWWPDNNATGAPKGQTFTTGDNLTTLNSITFEIRDTSKAEPTKTYVLRLSTIDKVDPSNSSTWVLNTFYTETAVQDSVQWIGTDKASELGVAAAPFMTWSFDAPVTLAGNTEYAIDIGMTSSTSTWQTGIPYLKRTGNEYAGGTRYMSGTAGGGIGDTTMNNVSGDYVFHLDMAASEADPQLPTVDAGSDWVSWNGAPLTLDDVVVINNSTSDLVYSWTAEPNSVTVDFSATNVESPTVTVYKSEGDPVTVTLTLAANYVGSTSDDVIDTMDIDVYDSSCLAAGAFGAVTIDPTDINGDCITDIIDLADLAYMWLYDYSLTEPAVK